MIRYCAAPVFWTTTRNRSLFITMSLTAPRQRGSSANELVCDPVGAAPADHQSGGPLPPSPGTPPADGKQTAATASCPPAPATAASASATCFHPCLMPDLLVRCCGWNTSGYLMSSWTVSVPTTTCGADLYATVKFS